MTSKKKQGGSPPKSVAGKDREGEVKNQSGRGETKGIDGSRQYKWIKQIHDLQPYIADNPFRVAKRDKNGKPTIQKPFHEITPLWFPCTDHDIPHQLIVSDFDSENRKANYVNSDILEDYLKEHNIPYHKSDHGGRSPHLYVFFKISDIVKKQPGYHTIREPIVKWILRECKIDIEESGFDMNNITASRHLIRALTKDFPEKIEFWRVLDDELKGMAQFMTSSKEDQGGKHNQEGSPYVNEGVFYHAELSEGIMKTYTFRTLTDTDEIVYYDNGVYRFEGEVLIKKECKKLLKQDTKKHRTNEVIHYIQCSTYTDRGEFDKNLNLVNFKNGFFNLKERVLIPHDPNILSFIQLPVKYDPDAKCPEIEKFFSEIVDTNDISLLEEIAGFCLLPDYRIQKAFMLHGEGSNGKSTFIQLIKAFLGPRNISAVPLKSLVSNRFAKASLFGKMANLFPDLPSADLTSTGDFKALTGGDFISAEKKFKDSFEFENRAKLLFSANELPKTKDNTNAFYRRWVIVEFPNTFEGDDDDKELVGKLTTEEELSGLLNLALSSLKGLLKRGGFSRSETTEEISRKYERLSNPLSAFLEDCCLIEVGKHIPKHELYSAFKIFVKENKLPILSETKFSTELKEKINFLTTQRKTIGEDRFMCWVGVRLNGETQNNLKREKTPDTLDTIDRDGRGVKGVNGQNPLKHTLGNQPKITHINMGESPELEEHYPEGIPSHPRVKVDKARE